MRKIAYLKHPVEAAKVASYRDKGFTIIDVAFAPDNAGPDDFVEGREAVEKPKPKAKKKPKAD